MPGFVPMAEYRRMARRVEELEAENAWIRATTGLDESRAQRIKAATGLSPSVSLLLSLFLAKPGQLLRKATLLSALEAKDPAHDRGDKVLDIYVCKLRAWLDAHNAPRGKQAIVTHWGAGYALRPDAAAWINAQLAAKAA